MERFFRKLRRNVRKRTGNMSTGTVLKRTGESLALFQNMGNPEYVKIVFGPGRLRLSSQSSENYT